MHGVECRYRTQSCGQRAHVAGDRAMAAGGEFVDGWLVAQVLGEGAYGE